MKKLAFIGNSEPPSVLLELFRKMTPKRSGIWKNLQGVDNYADADYFAVIDWLPPHLGIDESKCIFLGAHPETMQAYRDMSGYKGLKMYDCKYTFGFGEWWIKYDYDYLSNLKPEMSKSKKLGAIVSNANSQAYHKKRLTWLEEFTKSNIDFNLYGRIIPTSPNMLKYYRGPCGSMDARGAVSANGNDHMSGKEQVYENHEYMIEFDATGENYFSERIFDCLLLWSVPIYWGGSNLHKYIPSKSFIYLDIDKYNLDMLNFEDEGYLNRLPYIAQARNLLLNKYQIWPRVHEAIFGEP